MTQLRQAYERPVLTRNPEGSKLIRPPSLFESNRNVTRGSALTSQTTDANILSVSSVQIRAKFSISTLIRDRTSPSGIEPAPSGAIPPILIRASELGRFARRG